MARAPGHALEVLDSLDAVGLEVQDLLLKCRGQEGPNGWQVACHSGLLSINYGLEV